LQEVGVRLVRLTSNPGSLAIAEMVLKKGLGEDTAEEEY